MKDKIFYTACFGFLLGVLWRSFFILDIYSVILFAVISLAVLAFFVFVSRNNPGIILAMFCLAVGMGAVRFGLADARPPILWESRVGEKVTLLGELVDEPSIREKNQQLVVELKEGDSRTKILLSAGLEEDYEYGEEINFTGTLKKPENFMTDTGKVFDYINYLRKDGVLYVMSYPQIEILSDGHGNWVKSGLFSAKNKFLEKINLVIPSPENLLLGGLILGERSGFSEDLRQSFVDTGTIHIIALSGYNVTIVAEWFMKLFSFLPLALAIWSGVVAIFLFILMTGAGSTSVRAGVMAGLALLARATGRNYEVGRALLLAGAGMVLWNPFILAFDVSFQLSFIATVAVIFLAPKVEKYFTWITERWGLRDIVSVTMAAYFLVLPFILYKMGNFSLVALPANILILPFIPLTMAFGFFTGLLGLIFPILSIPVGFIAGLFLSYELGVVRFFASLSFSSFSFPNFPLLLALLIYAYFIYKLFGENIKQFFTFSSELS